MPPQTDQAPQKMTSQAADRTYAREAGESKGTREPGTGQGSVAWMISPGTVAYEDALLIMDRRVAEIREGRAPETIWLLEHPPLYTAGTRARPEDIRNPLGLPVHATGRGGQVTYHGPGQRIVYVMLDVQSRFGGDMGAFIAALEVWIIATLDHLGIPAHCVQGRTGVWVRRPAPPSLGAPRAPEDKIAAIGLRVRRGISFHGMAFNVAPDLTHYEGIVPCGITDAGVTSLRALGSPATLKDVDIALEATFRRVFGARIAPEIDPAAERATAKPDVAESL